MMSSTTLARYALAAARAAVEAGALVAAHNEETEIGERVANLLENGSARLLEVIVISDGSTDRTAECARDAGARVIELPRGGKIRALHEGVSAAAGDVLVITDANTRFETGAVDLLVEPLRDPDVGIAAGDLRYSNPAEAGSAEGENLYWKYETMIKTYASDSGLLLMGAGGIYAVRKEDWPAALETDLADDSYVPLSLHRAGRRNIFVRDAVAYERAGTAMREEWRRRVRMVAQDIRVARSLTFGLPNPLTCFALVSQKAIRWFLFPLGLLALVSARPASRVFEKSAAMRPVAIACRSALPLSTAVLLTGSIAAWTGRRIPVISAVCYLAGATAAAFIGALSGLFGRSQASWEKAASTRRACSPETGPLRSGR